MTICLLRIDMKKVSYLQIIAVSTSKKKPVGHSIGMVWNATGSFFLIKEYTHLKYELKTNKRAEMLFSLEDVYIAANLAHSSDTSIYTANK